MTQDNNSYFFQNHSSTKKKPTSGLLNRRQQNAAYLQQLELPSLPPLSQMLTNKTNGSNNSSKTAASNKDEAIVVKSSERPLTNTTNNNNSNNNTTTNSTATTTNNVNRPQVAANNTAQGAMTTYPSTGATATAQVPSQPVYFGDYTMNGDPAIQQPQSQTQQPANANLQRNLVVPNPVVSSMNNGGSMTQLMDGTFAPNMMPLDSMYPMNQAHPTASGLSTDPATAAAMVAAAGYNMKYNDQDMGGVGAGMTQRIRQPSSSSTSSTDKIYSFVAIPGTNQKKRPRRRYDEIERLYHCNWAGCTKAYGTLNHLNAHVSMQKHGPKRHPAEFKEMRKEWRRQKKDRESSKKAAEEAIKQQQQHHQQQQHQQQQFMQVPPAAPFSQQAFQPAVYGQIPTGSMPLTGFY